jgi:outer membrane biosynthesis protein TonB
MSPTILNTRSTNNEPKAPIIHQTTLHQLSLPTPSLTTTPKPTPGQVHKMQPTPSPKDTSPPQIPKSQTTPARRRPCPLIISKAPAPSPVPALLPTQACTRTPLYDDPNHIAYGWQQMDQVLVFADFCALKGRGSGTGAGAGGEGLLPSGLGREVMREDADGRKTGEKRGEDLRGGVLRRKKGRRFALEE